MSTLRKAAQQALEALENGNRVRAGEGGTKCQISLEGSAITAIRAALAQQAEPVQEPVAWYFEARHIDSAWGAAVSLKHPGPEGVYTRNVKPLYTAPPRCPNCASLEAQNAELDRKLAELEQDAPVQEPVAWVWGTSHELAPQDAFSWVQTAIHKMPLYTAPPQRKPLTDEEILKAIGWERAEMYMKLTPNFPVAEAKKETLKNARAIERAHGIGEQS